MAIRCVIIANKRGQVRLVRYYHEVPFEERISLEGEMIRKCLPRTISEVSFEPINRKSNFVEFRDFKLVYKRFGLIFIVGVDADENELGVLQFIHFFVEVLEQYFKNV